MGEYTKTPPDTSTGPLKEGHKWLNVHKIPYTVTPEGVTKVTGDISIRNQGQASLPFVDIVPWEVSGSFDCCDKELKSLVGAPQLVGKNFRGCDTQLTSLVGGPQAVGGNVECYQNKLTSLAGAPKTVGGDVACSRNLLTSLGGAPRVLAGVFGATTTN